MVIILWYKPFVKSGLIGGNIEVFIKAFLYANTQAYSSNLSCGGIYYEGGKGAIQSEKRRFVWLSFVVLRMKDRGNLI